METFNIDGDSDIVYERTPLIKRIKTQALTFIRQHYLNIFKFLLLLILLLLIVIAVMSVNKQIPAKKSETTGTESQQDGRDSNLWDKGDDISTKQSGTSTTNFKTFEDGDDFSTKGDDNSTNQDLVSKETTKATFLKVSKDFNRMYIEQNPDSKIPCGKINCNTGINYCIPKTTTYLEIKRYMCCCKSQFPYSVRFLRYMYNLNSKAVSLIFSSTSKDFDPTKLSAVDLETMEELPALPGIWSVIQESDTEYYLQYNLVDRHSNNDPDEN